VPYVYMACWPRPVTHRIVIIVTVPGDGGARGGLPRHHWGALGRPACLDDALP